jgi:alkanesulfonate monooxygenase SsuD/methylene tetrahydromethanopterin reductase-like flavin-dependent oxidoreductase (luciferase family)
MPTGSRPVKVGVLLPRQLDELGEWLADAAAFDAAGADALWVDPAVGPELDSLALLAALAALTSR